MKLISTVIAYGILAALPPLFFNNTAVGQEQQQKDDEPSDLSRTELYKIFIIDKGLGAPAARKPKKHFNFPDDADDGKVYGIDVSHHKGEIDWKSVAQAGAMFAYAKATEGATFVDKRFGENIRGAQANRIPAGAYHFLSSQIPVAKQIENFVSQYAPVRGQSDLPPVLDLEWDYSKLSKTDRWESKSPEEIVPMALEWLRQIEARFGVAPVVYTNQNWWESRIRDQGAPLARYKIWMSRYGRFGLDAPPLPKGLDWAMWQFSEHGQIAGVNGRVDVNFLRADLQLPHLATRVAGEGEVRGKSEAVDDTILLENILVKKIRLTNSSEQEQIETIVRLKEIIRDSQETSEVTNAECALAIQTDETKATKECLDQFGRTRSTRSRRGKRIVNGIRTVRFPSSGALLSGLSKELAIVACSGTLVSPNKFLTAAHCFDNNDDHADGISVKPRLDRYWIYFQHAGIFDVGEIDWPEKEYKAEGDAADLALVTLQSNIHTINATPINDSAKVINNFEGSIVGFGRTGGSREGGLKDDYGIKRVGFVRTAQCQDFLKKNGHICWNFESTITLGLQSNTCNIDSGGALYSGSGPLILMGVTTAGRQGATCGIKDHSWDVDVFNWHKWLSERGATTSEGKNADSDVSMGTSPAIDPEEDVVGATFGLDDKTPMVLLEANVAGDTKSVYVAMNAEDDTNGKNDFDLFVLKDPKALDLSNTYCKNTSVGQFAFCEVNKPEQGPMRIVVRRKKGNGLAQITVTQVR